MESCRTTTIEDAVSTMSKFLGFILAVLLAGPAIFAQSAPPVLSGDFQFVGSSNAGALSFQPVFYPVLLVPLGKHWLIESRADLQGFISRENGKTGPYEASFVNSLDYLQVDYIANAHVTFTAGRFLVPFNMFGERYSAAWVRNLLDFPIIYPIGTRTSGSSNGFMLRGVIAAQENWELNYTAYFSALSTIENLQSGRAAGGRMGMFFPHAGFEVGGSYQRFLQNGDYNATGAYFSWEPLPIPLDTRGEFAYSPNGQGYWLEGAYQLSRDRSYTTWSSRLQLVARVQQFFRGKIAPQDFLPAADTNRVDFGLNYYLPHDVRLNGSYGRQYSSTGNFNSWNFQITYHFLFPLLPGGPK
jgi:hypothetical protein